MEPESRSETGPVTNDPQAALDRFAAALAHARESAEPLAIVGGATKAFYGRQAQGKALETGDFGGIVEYEPAELVVTVRAGTPLATLQKTLAAERQMLGFEPPSFGPASTIGGVVAAGLSGPRRPWAGAVRDGLLGVELMTSEAEVLRFGGQVMKNVAGYDVSRLMAGSMGTLGLLLTVSLKVLPQAELERTIAWTCGASAAHRLMRDTARKPLPLSAMSYDGERLRMRLSGSVDGVEEAIAGLTPDGPDDDSFWRDLNDQRLAFFGDEEPVWRLSVPPAAPRIDIPGLWLCDWGGALRWVATDAPESAVREQARLAGGHATVFRGASDTPFTPLDPVSAKLHRRLKNVFDPHGVFNAGRLYADL